MAAMPQPAPAPVAAPERPEGRSRRPIVRTRRVVPGELTAAEREPLHDTLYGLWQEYIVGMSREEYVRTHIFDDTRLHLLYGPEGEFAGFLCINLYDLEVSGVRRLVLTAGGYSRPEYDTVSAMMRCGLSECARIWLRAPSRSLALVAIATSPISYRGAGAWTAHFHPEPGVVPPPEIEAMMQEVMARRGFSMAKEDPWITAMPMRQRQIERLLASRAMANPTPYMRAFLERAPRWAEGYCPVLWMPIDRRNILHALRTLARGPKYR